MTIIANTSRLIHPVVLEAMARAGHKAKVLITDAMYSTATATNSSAPVVHAALEPGSVTVTEVVEVLLRVVPFEEMTRMLPESGEKNFPVHEDLNSVLSEKEIIHRWVSRAEFYDEARSGDVALCIATGDTRRFANVILTVGVPNMAT